jgi:hypothetical protein
MMLFKKIPFIALCITSVIFGGFACKKDVAGNKQLSALNNNVGIASRDFPEEGRKTVLGQQLPNPWTTENMHETAVSMGRENAENITTTHYYVRYNPKDYSEISTLEDKGLILTDHPMDYEIIAIGELGYRDPSISAELPTYQYAVIPVNTPIPNVVPYQILAELHLTEDNELIQAAFIHKGLAKLSQHVENTNTANRTSNCGNFFAELGRRRNPAGQLQVWDNQFNRLEPVKWVTVRATCWFHVVEVWTERDGTFRSPQSFDQCADIQIFFKNDRATFRGALRAMNGMPVLRDNDYVVNHYSDEYCCGSLENINIQYWPNNGSTIINEMWVAASLMTGVLDYYDYSSGFAPPANLNIWLTNWGLSNNAGGAAPMLGKIYLPWNTLGILNNVTFGFIAPSQLIGTTAIMQVLQAKKPDIIIPWGFGARSDNMYEVFFHEVGHASHFKRAGESYWTNYVNYIIDNNGYGIRESNNSGRCAMAESWAETVGTLFADRKYGLSHSNTPSSLNADRNRLRYRGILERFDPIGNDGLRAYDQWIPYGIYLDLQDNNATDNTNGIMECANITTDNISGFTMPQLWNALDATVTTPQQYRVRLQQQNNWLSPAQQTTMNNLFTNYTY